MPNRVLTPGLFAGIRPAFNSKAIQPFDINLFAGQNDLSKRLLIGIGNAPPLAQKLLPSAIQQNQLRQVLPCVGVSDRIRIGRPPKANKGNNMYPQTGYARHQPKGLATLPQHPMNNPLMPIASNHFPYGPSPLGQPK